MSNSELKEILQRIVDKDYTAFDDLAKDYSKVIIGIALSLLNNQDDCHDIVQMVMSKLYTMPKENFPTSHELAWLYTVTKNEALQFVRKEHLHRPLDDTINMTSETDELSSVIDMDTYDNMINSLDEQSKTIVTLKVISGFSHKEIGKMLHIPTGTVQWKYHIAVHKLRLVLINLALFVLSLTTTVWRSIKLQEPIAGEPGNALIAALPLSFIAMCVVSGGLGISLVLLMKNRRIIPKQKLNNIGG